MSKSRTRSPRHLSDTALVLLGRAADSEDEMLLPIPKLVRARGKALERLFQSLLRQGLIAEVPVGLAGEAWRSDHEGRYGLRITAAGLKAIGVPALVSGIGSEPDAEQATGSPGGSAAITPSRPTPTVRPGTKRAMLIELLSRASGQKIDDLVKALGWQPHTVRAVIAGLRKSGHAVSRTKSDAGQSVYRIEAEQPAIGEDAASDQNS